MIILFSVNYGVLVLRHLFLQKKCKAFKQNVFFHNIFFCLAMLYFVIYSLQTGRPICIANDIETHIPAKQTKTYQLVCINLPSVVDMSVTYFTYLQRAVIANLFLNCIFFSK